MNKHILYFNYILYNRSDKFIWRKLRANLLAAVFYFYYYMLDIIQIMVYYHLWFITKL